MRSPLRTAALAAASVTGICAALGGAGGALLYSGLEQGLSRDVWSVLAEGVLPGVLIGGAMGAVFGAAILAGGAVVWAIGPSGPGRRKGSRPPDV